MKPYKFNSKFLESLLSKIKAEGEVTFLAGDFNFNFNQNKGNAEFLEHLFYSTFFSQITLQTRSTSSSQTLIDNISINNQAFHSISGNLATSISYLLPQFIIIENFKELYETYKGKFSNRNFKKLNKKYFNVELKCIDWFLANKNNNLDFRTFFHVFNKTLDKHASRKQGMRKVKKLELKPWVTKGIKTFMKLRDKLYKEA